MEPGEDIWSDEKTSLEDDSDIITGILYDICIICITGILYDICIICLS